jgi:hypothetical protein
MPHELRHFIRGLENIMEFFFETSRNGLVKIIGFMEYVPLNKHTEAV